MAKNRKSEPSRAIAPRDVVMERIAHIRQKFPDLVSFDPEDATYETMVMRCKVDPGIPRESRDGWIGRVKDWYFGSYTVTDEATGELVTLPSLALISTDGDIVRLSNSEPALRGWLAILREIGAERIRAGLNVKVYLRTSASAVGPYWQIVPI